MAVWIVLEIDPIRHPRAAVHTRAKKYLVVPIRLDNGPTKTVHSSVVGMT